MNIFEKCDLEECPVRCHGYLVTPNKEDEDECPDLMRHEVDRIIPWSRERRQETPIYVALASVNFRPAFL